MSAERTIILAGTIPEAEQYMREHDISRSSAVTVTPHPSSGRRLEGLRPAQPPVVLPGFWTAGDYSTRGKLVRTLQVIYAKHGIHPDLYDDPR